ncbi:hypothetical protein OROMI_017688 [Orobanche minor]
MSNRVIHRYALCFNKSTHKVVSAGDGLTFFLAPNGSEFNYTSDGVALGLPFYHQHPFMALKFDIYWHQNELIPNTNDTVDDPDLTVDHVGIDVDPVKSLTSTAWDVDVQAYSQQERLVSKQMSTALELLL